MADFSGALQENVLTLLATSDQDCQLIRLSIPVELFANRVFRDIAAACYQFVDSFGRAPKDHLPDLLEAQLGDEDDGELYREILRQIKLLGQTINRDYVLANLDRFAREYHFRTGLVAAARALQDDDLAKAEAIVSAAMNATAKIADLGFSLETGQAELKRRGKTRDWLRTGIAALDRHELGPARKEMFLLLGKRKSGKTGMMCYLAKRAALTRWRTVYITLEVNQFVLVERMLQGLFSMTAREEEDGVELPALSFGKQGEFRQITHAVVKRPSLDNAEGMAYAGERLRSTRIGKRVWLKEFPSGSLSLSGLESYLDLLERRHRFTPDLLIVDYPDLMEISSERVRTDTGRMYVGLRGLATKRNCALAAPSQLNRLGESAYVANATHTSEDISKIATADIVITYNQTTTEREYGVARLYVSNARTGRDQFSVVITQSYAAGQFCIDSMLEPRGWREMMTAAGAEEGERDEQDVA